jgi:hypothetical protein
VLPANCRLSLRQQQLAPETMLKLAGQMDFLACRVCSELPAKNSAAAGIWYFRPQQEVG